jgi:hypothetical protein
LKYEERYEDDRELVHDRAWEGGASVLGEGLPGENAGQTLRRGERDTSCCSNFKHLNDVLRILRNEKYLEGEGGSQLRMLDGQTEGVR